MIDIIEISGAAPDGAAVGALERGHVLLFLDGGFALSAAECAMIAGGAAASEGAKNISYDAAAGELKGTEMPAPGRELLKEMMARYAEFARDLVHAIAPGYARGLRQGRTSFRPAEIAGRETSWRKDDRRLHVDAFPSTPTQGARILRVFMNVDQAGTPRQWRVGPDFESYARNFLPRVGRLPVGAATVLAWTGITKTRRSGYDQVMLGLHDAAKRDTEWQASAPARDVSFLPGQVWMVFTDQTPHAALAGRNALEQSFYVAPEVMTVPEQSPLAVLSRLTGRDLARVLV